MGIAPKDTQHVTRKSSIMTCPPTNQPVNNTATRKPSPFNRQTTYQHVKHRCICCSSWPQRHTKQCFTRRRRCHIRPELHSAADPLIRLTPWPPGTALCTTHAPAVQLQSTQIEGNIEERANCAVRPLNGHTGAMGSHNCRDNGGLPSPHRAALGYPGGRQPSRRYHTCGREAGFMYPGLGTTWNSHSTAPMHPMHLPPPQQHSRGSTGYGSHAPHASAAASTWSPGHSSFKCSFH